MTPQDPTSPVTAAREPSRINVSISRANHARAEHMMDAYNTHAGFNGLPRKDLREFVDYLLDLAFSHSYVADVFDTLKTSCTSSE